MADLRPQYNEQVIGANHPILADVTNRAWDIEHAVDGTHNTSKDVDSFGGLATAIAIWNADGSDVTLHVGTSQTSLSANLTVNSNISLICLMQGLIPIDVGKILTINGYFDGVGQCFSGAGSVAGLSFAYAEWFGFSTSATAANNATYITAVLAASQVVTIGIAGTYSCNPFSITTNRTTLKGLGHNGGGVVLSYPGATSFITLNANRCRIEDLYLDGPDAADANGDIGIDILNVKNDNLIENVWINAFDTGIKDDGYSNLIRKTKIYDFGAVGIDLVGGSNASLEHVSISDSDSSGKCVSLSGGFTHVLFDHVIFGESEYGVYMEGSGSARNLTFLNCHWEGVSITEIFHSYAIGKVNIIGGRMEGTLRSGASDPSGTDWILIGVYAAGAVVITNDAFSTFTFSNCIGIGGADVTNGVSIELDQLSLDESGNLAVAGNIIAGGNMLSKTVITTIGEASRYSRKVTGITNNSATDIYKATAPNVTISGWVTITAIRNGENSSHIYQVHSDPAGVNIVEIGVGKNRNATVALTAAVAGSDLTFTIDTTAADWAGDAIIVTVTADLTNVTGPITYTDL